MNAARAGVNLKPLPEVRVASFSETNFDMIDSHFKALDQEKKKKAEKGSGDEEDEDDGNFFEELLVPSDHFYPFATKLGPAPPKQDGEV